MSSLTLVVKPVGNSCPLRCDYCYNNDPHLMQRQSSEPMSTEVLEKMLFEFYKVPQRKHVLIWHGGEPLVAGINFYKKVLDIQKRLSSELGIKGKTTNRIQSNGVLIDENWAQFIAENKFRPGISVDGPKEVHDKHRVYPNGKGSLEDTIRGATIIKQHGVTIGVGAVITKDTIEHPIEVFEFLRRNFNSFDFSPCFETAANGAQPFYGITSQEYAEFIKETFEYWWVIDDPKIKVKSFMRYVKAILGKAPKVCSMSSGCDKFLCVDGSGKVYPCGRFGGLPEMFIGDINTQSFDEIRNSEKYKNYLKKALYLPEECQNCKWKFACNNGCAAIRYTEDGKFLNKNPLCESTKEILNFVEKLVKEAKKRAEKSVGG